jgi:arginine exporter protein ArgO
VTGALVAGLLAGYGVAVPVGAIAPILIGLTARTSLRVGAAAALGVATADGLYALAAVIGGAALAGAVREVATGLRLVAAAVLIGVAARIALTAVRGRPRASGRACRGLLGLIAVRGRRRASAAPDATAAPDTTAPPDTTAAPDADLARPGRAYLGLLGLTLLNPATIVYFGALVLGRQAAGGLTAGGEAVFVAAAFAASASWQLLLAGAGALVGRLLTGPRGRVVTAVASSAMIAVLAANLVMG